MYKIVSIFPWKQEVLCFIFEFKLIYVDIYLWDERKIIKNEKLKNISVYILKTCTDKPPLPVNTSF